jgi:DNA ligase (NAD+)
MYNMDGFGKKSVDKLLENIERSRNIDLQRFIYSLSIPLIGKSASKDIAKVCNNDIQTFIDILSLEKRYTFTNIEGFGTEMEKSLCKWWWDNNGMFLELMKEFNFIKAEKPVNNTINLNEKTFVITGSLTHYQNRDELVKTIEGYGGKVAGNVSAKTSYLINNDITSNSGKNSKAKKLGIQIITEEEFIKMIS